MNLDITGRHVEITDELREFTENRLRKLERLLEGPLEIHVVLGIEKHRHLAEIQVKSRTAVLSGMEETADLQTSIREVAEKLERQALKHKEKMTERRRREGVRAADAVVALQAEGEAGAATTTVSPTSQVVHSDRYRRTPCTVEDALAELEETGESLLLFEEAGTGQVRVLHRMADGQWGLIAPDF